MKYVLIFFITILFFPAFAQSDVNPSLTLQTLEIPYHDFNNVARDMAIIELEEAHERSWQVTIDNNLVYANPNGNAVIRFYDVTTQEKFIEIGMGSQPDEKYWVAVQTDDEGYVVIHKKLERGWIPRLNSILAYTPISGLTVNNGERIVVTNLDIGIFGIGSYSVYGMESSTDPPATNSGSLVLEFLSGDPAENQFYLIPFFVTAGIGALVAVLFVTKKRS